MGKVLKWLPLHCVLDEPERKTQLNPRGVWVEVSHDELVELCAMWEGKCWARTLVQVLGDHRGVEAYERIQPYSDSDGVWLSDSFEAFIARLKVTS